MQDLTPGSGRSPGEGHGNPLQYSCLENSMDRGAWQPTVHGSQRIGHKWTVNTQSVQSVQLLSHVWGFETPRTAAHQASLSITNSQSLLKVMSIESVMPSNHQILCRPLLLLPSIFPSIRVSSNESVLWIRWPKYWSFSFSISPSNGYSGLISFRIDWFDLAVQGTLKSLLWHHSSKASILWCSAFFMVQLSYPYMKEVKVLATQSCPTLWKLMDCRVSSSSVHGILQARILDWIAMPFSWGSSQLKNQTLVSCIAGSH